MNILVTGSNGFIGSKIVQYLIDNNNYVYGLYRSENKIKKSSYDLNIDISNENLIELVKNKVFDCDAIVHVAASISYDDFDLNLSKVNCFGTHQIIKLAKELKVKKFIYFSSLPIIGKPSVLPITENHPLDPQTTYHTTKMYGEYLTSSLIKHGIDAISLRVSSPIGIGMPDNKIFSVFVKNSILGSDINITGSGDRIQNYIDVRDICRGVESCLKNNGFSGILNLCGSDGISDIELAKLCIKILGANIKIISNSNAIKEEDKWIVSIKKIKEILHFEPKYKLVESIKNLGDHYENCNNK